MMPVNCRIFFISFIFFNFLISESKITMKRIRKDRTKYKIQGKIVNGLPVEIDKYPYAVQFLNTGRLCGGVILHSQVITTAAHCTAVNLDVEDMIIQAGAKYVYDYNADWYDVLSFVMHEKYNKDQAFACDIALVFTKELIQFSDRVQKAILVNHDKWMDEQFKNFTVIGWGYTKVGGEVSEVGLQMTSLRYVTSRKCSRLHDDYKLTPDMFCLYGEGKSDACQGDSGGAVIWKGMLVGLTSHGEGCASKNKPSVYSNVWYMSKWIEKHISQFFDDYCDGKYTTQETLLY